MKNGKMRGCSAVVGGCDGNRSFNMFWKMRAIDAGGGGIRVELTSNSNANKMCKFYYKTVLIGHKDINHASMLLVKLIKCAICL